LSVPHLCPYPTLLQTRKAKTVCFQKHFQTNHFYHIPRNIAAAKQDEAKAKVEMAKLAKLRDAYQAAYKAFERWEDFIQRRDHLKDRKSTRLNSSHVSI